MKLVRFTMAAFAAAALVLGAPARADNRDKILEFDTMAPVTGPFVGAANPIRGIGGGGVPWAIASAKGELRVDGLLEIDVRGLVIVSTGVNPVAAFRGVVSCLTNDAGVVTTVNVSTGDFPANAAGDSRIEATLVLPTPCVAPIVFVTNPAGRWFAATGN